MSLFVQVYAEPVFFFMRMYGVSAASPNVTGISPARSGASMPRKRRGRRKAAENDLQGAVREATDSMGGFDLLARHLLLHSRFAGRIRLCTRDPFGLWKLG